MEGETRGRATAPRAEDKVGGVGRCGWRGYSDRDEGCRGQGVETVREERDLESAGGGQENTGARTRTGGRRSDRHDGERARSTKAKHGGDECGQRRNGGVDAPAISVATVLFDGFDRKTSSSSSSSRMLFGAAKPGDGVMWLRGKKKNTHAHVRTTYKPGWRAGGGRQNFIRIATVADGPIQSRGIRTEHTPWIASIAEGDRTQV